MVGTIPTGYVIVCRVILALSLSLSLSLSPSLSFFLAPSFRKCIFLHVHIQTSLDQWCVPLLQSCEQYISSVLQVDKAPKQGEAGSRLGTPPLNSPIINEDEAICYLFTLGEVAQVHM